MSVSEDGLRKQIFASMQLKETDELVDIYMKQDKDEWSELAFSALEEILTERLGYLPALPPLENEPPDQPTVQQLMMRLVQLEEQQNLVWEEIRDHTSRWYIIGALSLGIFLGLVGTIIFVLFLMSLIT